MQKLYGIMRKYGMEDCASLSLEHCRITRQYLLDRLPFSARTAFIGLIPYYPEVYDKEEKRNISVYASVRDYHLFVSEISACIINEAEKNFPGYHFALFTDHSPIDERDAAAKAGLGVTGKNGLLITQAHSSFVFICEIITDLETDSSPLAPLSCEGCGLCEKECPVHLDMQNCLSALTQKKGRFSPGEAAEIKENGCAWGCDICQQVCPHTKNARTAGTLYSTVPFFNEKVNACPTLTDIDNTADFKERAYCWRGPDTIKRNLKILDGTYSDMDWKEYKKT